MILLITSGEMQQWQAAFLSKVFLSCSSSLTSFTSHQSVNITLFTPILSKNIFVSCGVFRGFNILKQKLALLLVNWYILENDSWRYKIHYYNIQSQHQIKSFHPRNEVLLHIAFSKLVFRSQVFSYHLLPEDSMFAFRGSAFIMSVWLITVNHDFLIATSYSMCLFSNSVRDQVFQKTDYILCCQALLAVLFVFQHTGSMWQWFLLKPEQ